jgi:hypothetical protein
MRALGLRSEVWVPELRRLGEQYVRMSDGAEKGDPDVPLRVLYCTLLVELTGERDAAEVLRRVASVPHPANSIVTYGALLALDALGTEQSFLLSMLDHPEPEIIQFAILTIGVHDDRATALAIDRAAQTHRSDPQVGEALSIIRFYRDNLAQYATIGALDEKIRFVEQRLSGAYVSIFGGTNWWDRHTGGDPLARWAVARWVEFSRQDPQRVAAVIQSADYHSSEDVTAGYRQFLTRLADPGIRRFLPEPGK